MKLEELEELMIVGKGLKTFIVKELPAIREEVSSCQRSGIDKHDDGFSTREECQSMTIRELCYYSFSGSFGNSCTYSDISHLNLNLLKEYFIKYLNIHKDEIMLGVADLMIDKAKAEKENAIIEIDKRKETLLKLFEY